VLQIDASRLQTADNLNGGTYTGERRRSARSSWRAAEDGSLGNGIGQYRQPAGRWPANLVLTHGEGCQPVGVRKVRSDGGGQAEHSSGGLLNTTGATRGPRWNYADPDGTETVEAWECDPDCPVFLLDQQSGTLTSGANPTRRGSDKFRDTYGDFTGQRECTPARGIDQGGASRFFYTAKAGRDERVTIDGEGHPTVKPLALMRWLVRLITPPGGLILDPFGGSGTTGEAAMLEGFTAVVLDKDPASCAKAKVRGHPLVRRRVVTTGPPVGPEQGSLL
jgi:hypothetical protein